MKFWIYEFNCKSLCLGERIKGGLLRPSAHTLRYSTISRALQEQLGRTDIKAVGTIQNYVQQFWTFSPEDRFNSSAKIPLIIEYLVDVFGKIFIPEEIPPISVPLKFYMGALRSKGFGESELMSVSLEESPLLSGVLGVRIPVNEASVFGIKKVFRPRFGYLYTPDTEDWLVKGKYVKAFFEESIVEAPKCLLKEMYSWALIPRES